MLIFCSLMGMEILAKSDKWFADGTFHTASKYFTQLYLIHGWFMHRMIPAVYVLMKKRSHETTADYIYFYKALQGLCSHFNITFHPTYIM
jgi:hypothetical protein